MSGAAGSTSISGEVSGAEGGSGASVAFVGSTEAAATSEALRRLRLSAFAVSGIVQRSCSGRAPFLRAEVAAAIRTAPRHPRHHRRRVHRVPAEAGG